MIQKTSRRNLEMSVSTMFGAHPVPGSFGAIGTINPASSERLKGFLTYLVKDASTSKFTAEVVAEGIRRLEGPFSRLSIRIIATNEAIESLANAIRPTGAEIEAQVPVTDSLNMVYIGYNTPARTLGSERRSEHLHAISEALSSADNAQGLKSLDTTKYGIKIIDGSEREFSASDREDIFKLLSTFGYDMAGAMNVVSDESNIIGVVFDRKTSKIVSISVTERRDIAIDGGRIMLHMAELTDAVTSDTERHNRLYPLLLNDVFRHIYNEHQEISLAYAESNVSNISLLNTAAMQWRQFNGMLPYHAAIMNPNTGELELKTMEVTSLDRDGMLKVIEEEAEQRLREAIRT